MSAYSIVTTLADVNYLWLIFRTMEEEKNFHLMGKISPFRIAMVNNEFLAVREINNFILSFRLTLRMAKGGKKLWNKFEQLPKIYYHSPVFSAAKQIWLITRLAVWGGQKTLFDSNTKKSRDINRVLWSTSANILMIDSVINLYLLSYLHRNKANCPCKL